VSGARSADAGATPVVPPHMSRRRCPRLDRGFAAASPASPENAPALLGPRTVTRGVPDRLVCVALPRTARTRPVRTVQQSLRSCRPGSAASDGAASLTVKGNGAGSRNRWDGSRSGYRHAAGDRGRRRVDLRVLGARVVRRRPARRGFAAAAPACRARCPAVGAHHHRVGRHWASRRHPAGQVAAIRAHRNGSRCRCRVPAACVPGVLRGRAKPGHRTCTLVALAGCRAMDRSTPVHDRPCAGRPTDAR